MMGRGQAVKARGFDLRIPGSSPGAPAIFLIYQIFPGVNRA